MIAPGRGPKRALAGLVALLAAAVSFALFPSAGLASGVRVGGASAQDAASFWTPARMAQAKPVEVTPQVGTGRRSLRPAQRGQVVRVPALAPRAKTPTDPAQTDFEAVADPTAPAYRVNGVVFFEVFFGLGRCSATSVNSPNLSVVITAGHCVNPGGGGHWYNDRWVFVPGYRYGQRPFGVFPAKWLSATPRWVREGNENGDVGIAVVGRNERGQRLGAAVGGVGFASGLKAKQVFDVHGYPGEAPFDGETQRICRGKPYLGHDSTSFLFGSGPLNLGVSCLVTGGASGGGWTNAEGLLNSVTDYGYTEDPETVYGAYFGKEVAQIYREAGRVR